MIIEEMTLYEYFEPVRNCHNNNFKTLKESVNTVKYLKKNIDLKNKIKELGIDITPLERETKEKANNIFQNIKSIKLKDLNSQNLSKNIVNSLDGILTKLSDMINSKVDSKLVKGVFLGGSYLLFQLLVETLLGLIMGPAGVTVAMMLLTPISDAIFNILAVNTDSSVSFFLTTSITPIKNFINFIRKPSEFKKVLNLNVLMDITKIINKIDMLQFSIKRKDETSEDRTNRVMNNAIATSISNAILLAFGVLSNKFLLSKIKKNKH